MGSEDYKYNEQNKLRQSQAFLYGDDIKSTLLMIFVNPSKEGVQVYNVIPLS